MLNLLDPEAARGKVGWRRQRPGDRQSLLLRDHLHEQLAFLDPRVVRHWEGWGDQLGRWWVR